MPSLIRAVTFDCADPYALAEFWSRALGRSIDPDSGPGGDEASISAADGEPGLLFLRVPEGKAAKNRLHLDLGPGGEATRDGEVERLIGLGAAFLSDHRTPDGRGWVVLADPENNEFCVELGDAELER
ncbi:VOC family protein [Actinorugispora endophytica]|uniref:Glyoxalase-like domain-containing protein n=1 Tax=Actinorugispora endophytica TaxID=1605990 RepID=A0A4R6V4U0_9ACTN|nr:VOC family protein [Actinorugispora endophytica]TDQ53307.1 hypothetical protein EV190_10496 [Actinorugispora endophytica]